MAQIWFGADNAASQVLVMRQCLAAIVARTSDACPMPGAARCGIDNGHVMPDNEDLIDRQDALHVLAVMGDLSMGQPLDHSRRVAALSAAMARQIGWDAQAVAQMQQIALLRWSGCTANGSEIAATLGDDVKGRAAMQALQFD